MDDLLQSDPLPVARQRFGSLGTILASGALERSSLQDPKAGKWDLAPTSRRGMPPGCDRWLSGHCVVYNTNEDTFLGASWLGILLSQHHGFCFYILKIILSSQCRKHRKTGSNPPQFSVDFTCLGRSTKLPQSFATMGAMGMFHTVAFCMVPSIVHPAPADLPRTLCELLQMAHL